MTHTDAPAAFARNLPRMPLIYLAVGLVAGAVIALQIGIMRVFSVGSWAHFGSLVVSLAMLGFGLTSAVMCVAKGWFERHWEGVAAGSLLLFGPMIVTSNLIAQQVPFNAIFLVSDPMQKWRLFANFMLYLLPFLCGAAFLGCVFLRAQRIFGRVYFADLVGSGLCGLMFLPAMFLLLPENLIIVPMLLWAVGSVLWFAALGSRKLIGALVVVAVASIGAHHLVPEWLGIPKLAVSDYKGVAYARKFPDSQRIYSRASPFGHLEIYGSSYLHFAPGLSDNAAFNLKEMPSNAYLGLYIDGEGPSGIIRDLPAGQTEYFKYLPMIYPYLIKKQPDTFVVQFGGGLSTAVALKTDSKSVTVAEGNPEILRAFREDKALREFTSDILANKKLSVIDYDGRIYLGRTDKRYDVIDLSLADSAGLSNPGGFAIVEKFAYTREAMTSYMRALNPDGVLSVTLWNKEEPPKSIIKLFATMAQAAKSIDPDISRKFFATSAYLSTATVLYKRDGFTPAEIETLRAHTRAMSFDALYYPGMEYDASRIDTVLEDYRKQIFSSEGSAEATPADGPSGGAAGERVATDNPTGEENNVLPATVLSRAAWHTLVNGGFEDLASRYVFDVRPLTNDRPYFAAYIKPKDLPNILDRLDLFQDEWGYLLLWATLAIAAVAALSLVMFPVIAGWRTIFSHYPGKFGTIIYFACLGAGYIMVEVGLIAHFVLALSNPTVSASILITGMLVFSGLGALVSERFVGDARRAMPVILGLIGVLLIAYGLLLDRPLDWIGTFPYSLRVLFCFLLIAPPAFLMGFPMSIGMTSLARLGKTHMFLWAWGINGCFSVLGAAIVPLLATAFGLSSVLMIAGGAYLLAVPALFALLLPLTGKWVADAPPPQDEPVSPGSAVRA